MLSTLSNSSQILEFVGQNISLCKEGQVEVGCSKMDKFRSPIVSKVVDDGIEQVIEGLVPSYRDISQKIFFANVQPFESKWGLQRGSSWDCYTFTKFSIWS